MNSEFAYDNYNLNYVPNMYDYITELSQPKRLDNLHSSLDGFQKGNLFPSIYRPYFKEEPFIIENRNERERLINKFREYSFAAHELNLYLDIYPSDTNMLNKFREYTHLSSEARREYESKYGPLLVANTGTENTFKWAKEYWPWEVK